MSKRLFLVRHGESENNVDKREARRMLRGDGWSWGQLRHVLNLLRVDMNSPLTEPGQHMAKAQCERLLKDDFVNTHGLTLCLYSHLQRARDTAQIMFESTGISMREHPDLYEKSLSEYAYKNLTERTEAFKRYLLSLPDDSIVIVGHGGFFNSFAAQHLSLSNCEVVQCTLNDDFTVSGVTRHYEGGIL